MEEVVCRGLMMRYILKSYPVIAMVVSALVFLGLHTAGHPFHALLYFLGGLNLAFVYYKTGRLEVPVIVHALGNLGVLIWIANS